MTTEGDYDGFFGVPVLVQLHVPIVPVSIRERQALPYSSDPELKQWIPQETQDAQGNFSAVQFIRYAVLRNISSTLVELTFVVPGPEKGTLAAVSTLVDWKNIAYVTRIVSVPDSAPVIILGA